jgi:hypothetical protein
MQQAPDLRVGAALGDLTEHLDLTCRQRRRSRLAHKVNKAVGDRRRQHRLTAGGVTHRIGQLGTRGVLEQITRCARFDRAQDVGVGLIRGDDDNPRARQRGKDPLGRHHAVDIGHPQIHENDIGAKRFGQCNRLCARTRLADNREVVFGVDHPAQAFADHGVVVDQ